jgi:hypothetical protein
MLFQTAFDNHHHHLVVVEGLIVMLTHWQGSSGKRNIMQRCTILQPCVEGCIIWQLTVAEYGNFQ